MDPFGTRIACKDVWLHGAENEIIEQSSNSGSFVFTVMPLIKAWIHFFCTQLWANNRVDWLLPKAGELSLGEGQWGIVAIHKWERKGICKESWLFPLTWHLRKKEKRNVKTEMDLFYIQVIIAKQMTGLSFWVNNLNFVTH